MDFMRTSHTHPLQIAEVPFDNGTLGITFCPGKKQADGMTGSWNRDLMTDIQTIKDWTPDYVVSCIEPHEYVGLQVPDAIHVMEQMGIHTVPLPFPDDTIPNASLNKALEYWIPQFAACIEKSGRVLFFCKGGLGRSGYLLCRTLIELGVGPAKAVKELRAVRHGAVYTIEQMESILKESWK